MHTVMQKPEPGVVMCMSTSPGGFLKALHPLCCLCPKPCASSRPVPTTPVPSSYCISNLGDSPLEKVVVEILWDLPATQEQ